ncbi:hypothetical protein ACKWTF_006378 [Chironomus riparius]
MSPLPIDEEGMATPPKDEQAIFNGLAVNVMVDNTKDKKKDECAGDTKTKDKKKEVKKPTNPAVKTTEEFMDKK